MPNIETLLYGYNLMGYIDGFYPCHKCPLHILKLSSFKQQDTTHQPTP